jgi:glycosyltransferase involved in cell wall biosynthesis
MIPALNAGGVERCVLETSRALVIQGHDSIVISNGGRLVKQLEQEGGKHIPLPVHRKSPLTLCQIQPLRQLLLTLQPDIVHARSRIPAWVAFLALRKMPHASRPHFVTTMHGLHSVSRYSAIMTKGEVVIAGSQTVAHYIRSNYPECPPERVQLIPEGVDSVEFPYGYMPPAGWLSAWQKQFPQLAGKTVLALPGRLTRLKGHSTFINLIESLHRTHPDLHGLIVGGAEPGKESYETELKAQIKNAGLESTISLTGHRSDIREVMSQCDLIFSLSTKPETFGRTVLEAIKLGKPVIGWNTGGVGEILEACYPDGCIPKDASSPDEALRNSTEQWLSNRTTPTNSALFQLKDMTDSTLNLYQRLVSTSSKPL